MVVIIPGSNRSRVGHVVMAEQLPRKVDEALIVHKRVCMKCYSHPYRAEAFQIRSQHMPEPSASSVPGCEWVEEDLRSSPSSPPF